MKFMVLCASMVYLNVSNLVQFGTYLSVFRTPDTNVSLVIHLDGYSTGSLGTEVPHWGPVSI